MSPVWLDPGVRRAFQQGAREEPQFQNSKIVQRR